MDQQDDEVAKDERFLKAMEEQTLENIENFHELSNGTGNPLYVWHALSELFIINNARNKKEIDPFPIPKWCMDHLEIICRRIRDLSEGKDYKMAPKPFGNLPFTTQTVESAWHRKPTLSPLEATRQVLFALGLRRPGWNAFERFRKLQQQDEETLFIESFCKIAGMSKSEAIKARLEEYDEEAAANGREKAKIDYARSVHKQIAASRNARKIKPP